MSDEAIILPDDPAAAKMVTYSAWASRRGILFPVHPGSEAFSERMAREDGATHKRCPECGGAAEKYLPVCASCRPAYDRKKWEAMPLAEVDTGVYALYDTDRYFFDWEEVEDYCDEHEIESCDLLLVVAESCRPGPFDPADYFEDCLADEMEVPDAVRDAFDALNEAIMATADREWAYMATHRRFDFAWLAGGGK